jgi:hypothetical protein
MSALRKAVQDYIEMRRSLGFKLHDTAIGLRKFVTSGVPAAEQALGNCSNAPVGSRFGLSNKTLFQIAFS